MTERPDERPPTAPRGRQRILCASLLAGSALLLLGLAIFGLSDFRWSVDRQDQGDPGQAEETASLAPLPGADSGEPRLSPVRRDPSAAGDRSAARPTSAANTTALSDLSLEGLEALKERERRFELAGASASDLDERSPADAELMEELDRHLEEEGFDDAQLEMELIRAQGSLQMLRAFNEAAKDR